MLNCFMYIANCPFNKIKILSEATIGLEKSFWMMYSNLCLNSRETVPLTSPFYLNFCHFDNKLCFLLFEFIFLTLKKAKICNKVVMLCLQEKAKLLKTTFSNFLQCTKMACNQNYRKCVHILPAAAINYKRHFCFNQR